MNRVDEIYEDLKLRDRISPGRTPWQTLRKRAEAIAATEPISVANRNLSRDWGKPDPQRPGSSIVGKTSKGKSVMLDHRGVYVVIG